MTDEQRDAILDSLALRNKDLNKASEGSRLKFSERHAIGKMLDENAALRRERDAFKEVASLLLRIDVFEGKSLRENDQIATYYRIEQKDFDALNKLLQAAFAVAAPDTEGGES